MTKPVILKPRQWRTICKALHEEYPQSVFMIRHRMKKVLGFTVRDHRAWVEHSETVGYEYQTHLDFYSESKRTMFLLKFSEYFNNEER